MAVTCVDSVVIGTRLNLISGPDGYVWSDTVPAGAWHLSGDLKPSGLCLDTLRKLYGVKSRLLPPEPFVQSLETCGVDTEGTIPWQAVMPKHAHRAFMRAIVLEAEESINTLPKDYYEGAWAHGSAVLSSLVPAHVDTGAWRGLINERVGNWRVVQTFRPNAHGQCRPVIYNRFGSRTGRLTTVGGPGILTLKRELRSILRSRHGNDGLVCYLDFSNLEARVLLYENGGRCDSADLYSHINDELFDGTMERDAIKGAVISELYGQGKYALGRRLNLSGPDLDMFVSRIKSHFRTDKLLHRVKTEFINNAGFITNRYGRRVIVDEPLDHIFINSYTQSTGVDVTMIGFHGVLETVKEHRIEPIFLLHDAMLLDCHRDDLKYLEAITSVNVKGYVQKFDLKLEIL